MEGGAQRETEIKEGTGGEGQASDEGDGTVGVEGGLL